MRRLLVIALAIASASVGADIYRWVDPATGRVMVTDTPPPGNARNVAKATTEGTGDPRSFAAARAAENFPVTLYTAADCVAECKQARELLTGRGIPFSEKMLQKPEDAEELRALVGDVFIPSLKVGKQSVRGFQAASYHNLLDLAGYPAGGKSPRPPQAPAQ